MIITQATIYGLIGYVSGLIIGLILSRRIYDVLITNYSPNSMWQVPVKPILLITLFIISSMSISVYRPLKKIKNTSIIEAINHI